MRSQERETEAQKIRSRIQRAKVDPNATIIPPLPVASIDAPTIKKVAAYTRVSTGNLEQVSSIENQTKFYTDKVSKHPEWELYRIYSDEGKSGTSLRHRDQFLEMLEDARQGKFDLIMCASVSRFARNIKDFINVIKDLKKKDPMHPVGVYFETENCYTLNSDSDDILDMHAMFAAWESRNKSRRLILSYDQRICTGQYPVQDLLGLRHTIDGQLIIVPEQAKTVRYVFLAYLAGSTFSEIAQVLTEKQRPTLTGKTEWSPSMARAIVLNERRWGDLNARKTIVIDYEEHIIIKNEGAQRRVAAFVPDHHEAIVSRDIAKAIQIVTRSNSPLGRGIRELSVVGQGMLKGFVSIFPGWSAIEENLLLSISSSAYSDDDLYFAPVHTINSWIPSGRMLISMTSAVLTIKNGRILLNNRAISCLSSSEYCELLYHPVYKILCFRSCNADAANAFYIGEGGKHLRSIKALGLAEQLLRPSAEQNEKFKIRGICRKYESATILMFYFDDAYSDIINSIAESDIMEDSISAANPLLGDLPTRSQIEAEVQELLDSM